MSDEMFVLMVAGDLYGKKHNMEVGFPGIPSLDDLVGHCESVYNAESRRLKPDHVKAPKFIVDSVKVFDDELGRWLDLGDLNHELIEWSQIYLHQPEGRQEDTQTPLPAPVTIRSPIEDGTNKERAFFLFHDMDFNGNGHINREEMQRIFNVLCLYGYSEKDVDEWFYHHDQNHDQVLSIAEFSKFATAHADVMEQLLRRSDLYWMALKRRPSCVEAAFRLSKDAQNAIQQYLDRYHRNQLYERELSTREEWERRRTEETKEDEVVREKERFVAKYGKEPRVGVEKTPPRTSPAKTKKK